MLFRTAEGNLIEIKKYNYKNDKLYYEKLFELKCQIPKLEKTFAYKNKKESNKQGENIATYNINS
jgi:hypothetical protein